MDIAIILISGCIFSTLTFFINNRLQLGGVMASAGVSLIVALCFYAFPGFLNEYLNTNIPVVAMGASFIGMASARIISKYWVIALSGIFFSFVFLFTSSFFEGYGGSLGTTALIALSAAYAINNKLSF